MQIEFYLPLPTLSGLIGFAIIYYMIGLMVSASFTLWYCDLPGYRFAHEQFNLRGVALLVFGALTFPFLISLWVDKRAII